MNITKTLLVLISLLASCLIINAQNTIQEKINSRLIDLHEVGNNNENFEGFERIKKEIGAAQIVMLGEQSHGDATTFETKIKLIKYLHQQMDFEILAFESSIYDCDKAWSMIKKGHNVKDALAKGIMDIWSVREELNPLFQYFEQQLERGNPIMIAGFDPQLFGKLAAEYFAEDLSSYLATFEDTSLYKEEIQQLQSYINTMRKLKKPKKKMDIQNIAFLQKLIKLIKNKHNNEASDFWLQTLKSLKVWISDTNLETDNRDYQMAENLIWLKEKYPGKKIICWGATSHFLYNASLIQMKDKKIQKIAGDYYLNHCMMGDYIKKKYGDNVYTIGFIAYGGSFGFNRSSTINSPLKNSLEYLIGKSANDNYFLPLKNLSLEGYLSRPLGHQYMTNDIAQVMDGVVFNRNMRRPYTDWDFLKYLVPENKISAKKIDKLKQNQTIRRLNEKNIKVIENKEKLKNKELI